MSPEWVEDEYQKGTCQKGNFLRSTIFDFRLGNYLCHFKFLPFEVGFNILPFLPLGSAKNGSSIDDYAASIDFEARASA